MFFGLVAKQIKFFYLLLFLLLLDFNFFDNLFFAFSIISTEAVFIFLFFFFFIFISLINVNYTN
ncbi:hypothetical protein ATX71_00210 [Oenococcus oeni]|nr:hypothetical protein C5H79_04170 [Oenococcus oeni]EJN91579.1 hypothetical protein AWRIB304_1769 [Oenococcus oeni AWRIB304]EJN99603.1 hypothetical protein AWRIB419_1338 [Oenococcus oeni AWRIB419]EJO02978.1 hypothetical protein AWRIB318_163 [Oenococcus oeni AWRIB318]EJO04544.1 hypothetical protein AWRIB422_1492 [Oenococcus oeni AWRIB422]EJO06537.1 hypothetical protein AWRIB548_559 [Oenococcus oeni AWRIB548]EJO07592.1 hypothetical protein AWRIB553_590 [Oenococcus oeni AWRIB553]EJO09012.1 hyp